MMERLDFLINISFFICAGPLLIGWQPDINRKSHDVRAPSCCFPRSSCSTELSNRYPLCALCGCHGCQQSERVEQSSAINSDGSGKKQPQPILHCYITCEVNRQITGWIWPEFTFKLIKKLFFHKSITLSLSITYKSH